MNLRLLVTGCAASSLLLAGSLPAGVIRFTATINGAQEAPNPTNSAATGSAVMVYDAETNRFDLSVTINDFSNTLTMSHIHIGAPGVAGGVITDLGAEAVYTRNGNTLTATFANAIFNPTAADAAARAPNIEALIRGNTYLNFHSGTFPAGEVRGQLIPDPVKLYAILSGANEVPARATNAYGAAQATYNPVTNKITTLVYVYNFTNTLTLSHIHEAPAGVNGAIKTDFGGASAYTQVGNTYAGLFADRDWAGTPAGQAVSLINNGAYVNVHSNIFGGGEIRGQLIVANQAARGRLINISARGAVGTGANVLISGFVVEGPEPVRVLAAARGPSLAAFNVPGLLADPVLAIFDSQGRMILSNDSFAASPHVALVSSLGFAPMTAAEAGAMLVLPPGAYTAIVSGASNGTGVGIAEAFELSW